MSPDVWVMVWPAEAFRELAQSGGSGIRLALRRPLRMLVVLGAVGSLATSGRISLRLGAACAESALFLPLLAIVSVLLARGRKISLARAVDLFFMGYGPWTLWLIALAAEWAFLPPQRAYELLAYRRIWYFAALLVFLWSLIIDFWYLRRVCSRTPFQAVGWLAMQRLIVWTAGLGIFLGASGWQVVASRFGP